MKQPASLIAIAFLSLISLAQLVRFLLGLHVTVDSIVIPVWLSLPAFFFTGGLAYWLWKERKKI